MRIKAISAFLTMAAMALPGWAAEGLPGASVTSADGRALSAERQAVRERCRAEPEKCRTERQARIEKWCAENPEKCKEMRARAAQRREQCKANPEQCRQEREAHFTERFKKADADGNGILSRAEAETGMPRLVRHFDTIDANRDGQVTMDEIRAARKARGARKGRSL